MSALLLNGCGCRSFLRVLDYCAVHSFAPDSRAFLSCSDGADGMGMARGGLVMGPLRGWVCYVDSNSMTATAASVVDSDLNAALFAPPSHTAGQERRWVALLDVL